MNEITVQEFLNTKLVNYASYDNIRSIASCIDGLKNSARKVLYTVHEKKIKDKTKVSQLASKCAEFSDYLHGDTSIQGVLVTLGKDYPGTNNIPLIRKYGNFGTRCANKASAPRYIFAKGSDEFFELFKYEDDCILDGQTFEGGKIEPKFYVPTLPMLLVNGSEGISTGFSQKILPRNPEYLRAYIIQYLTEGDADVNYLVPWYKGFTGEICKDSEDNNRKWWIYGKIDYIGKNEYLISEVPLNYDLTGYMKILDKLQEEGKILKYQNESDGNNEIKFRLWMPKDYVLDSQKIYIMLKLYKAISENYTCINEFNKIVRFESSKEIIDYYIDVKLRYLQKRKDYLLTKYKNDLSILKSKMEFINCFINNNIIIINKSKNEIENQLDCIDEIIKVDNSYIYLLNMPIHSLTKEKLQSLASEIKATEKLIKDLTAKDVKNIWIDELNSLNI